MVFFDKFCPDLHGTAAAAAAALGGIPTSGAEGGANYSSSAPSPGTPSPPSPPASGPLAPSSVVAAACRWCSRELGSATICVLSDDDAGERQAGGGGGGGGVGGGDAGGEARVLDLRDFLRRFVAGGDAAEGGELARRGDLFLAAHLANKAKVGYHIHVVYLAFLKARSLDRGGREHGRTLSRGANAPSHAWCVGV